VGAGVFALLPAGASLIAIAGKGLTLIAIGELITWRAQQTEKHR